MGFYRQIATAQVRAHRNNLRDALKSLQKIAAETDKRLPSHVLILAEAETAIRYLQSLDMLAAELEKQLCQ